MEPQPRGAILHAEQFHAGIVPAEVGLELLVQRDRYGLLVWAMFEAGIAPALGRSRHHGTATRLAFLADHLVYGMVVGASPWPHRD